VVRACWLNLLPVRLCIIYEKPAVFGLYSDLAANVGYIVAVLPLFFIFIDFALGTPYKSLSGSSRAILFGGAS